MAGGNSRKMRELTAKRAVAAMPVAGSYRAIDFVLSNMTNSHIQKVDTVQCQIAERASELIKMVGFRKETGRIVRVHAYDYG